MGPEFILISLAMYAVWRLWMSIRGESGSPKGKWTSRTDAMSEYRREHPELYPPMTRRGWVVAVSVFLVEGTLIAWFLFWAISRAER